MIRRPPRSTQSRSSAASDVYKRQNQNRVVGRRRRSDIHLRQVRILGEVEPERTPLGTGQRDLLDGVESYCAEADRLGYGLSDDRHRTSLHQPQDLDELPLAAMAHAGLEEMTQMLEGLG